MSEIERIRSEHVQDGDPGDPHCAMCSDASYPIWPCDTAIVLARLDALTAEASDVARENEALIEEVKAAGEQIAALAAERDAQRARAERAENALRYYAEVREYARIGGDPPDALPPIMHDEGRRARAALVAAGGEGQG